jgi:hypothetical protein
MAVMAVCVGMTVQYAVQHSDSWAARCVQAAWTVVVDWNPVVQVSRMVSHQSVSMMRPAKPDCCVQNPTPCMPAEQSVQETMPPVIDVIDLGTLQGLTVQTDQEAMTEPVQAAEMVPAGAIEESEPQQEMPPADEDADKAATAESGVDYWLGLFREGGDEAPQVEEIQMMPTEDGQWTSEGAEYTIELQPTESTEPEAELLPMPHEEEATDGALKQTGATEESDKPAEPYPGCPSHSACPAQRCPSSQAAPEDKEPGKAEIDTMEFRSTDDAKPGEFEPKPMQ